MCTYIHPAGSCPWTARSANETLSPDPTEKTNLDCNLVVAMIVSNNLSSFFVVRVVRSMSLWHAAISRSREPANKTIETPSRKKRIPSRRPRNRMRNLYDRIRRLPRTLTRNRRSKKAAAYAIEQRKRWREERIVTSVASCFHASVNRFEIRSRFTRSSEIQKRSSSIVSPSIIK